MIHRNIPLSNTHSYFLFGARGTGKTTLLHMLFTRENALFIDLLDPFEADIFLRNPLELKHRISALPSSIEWIIIDEIQKVPRLLDLVHQLIETKRFKFVLTGSSGRKLKRGVSNLLAGRAFVYHLFPFTFKELGDSFDLDQALQWGTMPEIYNLASTEEKSQYLRAYALTYLKEEIVSEQLIRKSHPFRSFLEIAAQSNGKIINFTKIASDIGVDTKTVQSYFSILEDTLIGHFLPSYHRSVRKRQRANPKFYFFDIGVKRALERTLNLGIAEGTYAYGRAFEHFIILEITRMSSYKNNDWQFSYLATKDNAEIDLIIERPGMPVVLIEIKSSDNIKERDIIGTSRFIKDFPGCEAYYISRDVHEKKIGSVFCFHWEKTFKVLGLV
jgi:predicted AAA+ superfamily ATPase